MALLSIYLYNESNKDPRYVKLTNNIGSYNYNGINLSLPSGVVRVTAPEWGDVITHIKFNAYSSKIIVAKVDNFTYVNNTTVDLYYSVDYIKTYFASHYVYQLRGIIKYSNRIYNPLLKDNRIPLNSVATTSYQTSTPFDYSAGRWCMVVKNVDSDNGQYNGVTLWFFTKNVLMEIMHRIQHDPDSQCYKTQILKIFWLPNFDSIIGIQKEQMLVFSLYNNYKEDTFTQIYEVGAEPFYRSTMPSTGLVWLDVSTGINITIDTYLDLTPISQYTLYVPFIGNVDISPEDLPLTVTQSGGHVCTPAIRYYFDLTSGTVCAMVNTLSGTASAYVPLPTVDLSVSNGEAERYNVEFNAMAQGVVGAVTGNPLALAGAATSYISGSMANNHTPANIGGVTSNSSMYRLHFELSTIKYLPTISFLDHIEMHGHLCNTYITSTTTPQSGEILQLDVSEITMNEYIPYRREIIDAINSSELKF